MIFIFLITLSKVSANPSHNVNLPESLQLTLDTKITTFNISTNYSIQVNTYREGPTVVVHEEVKTEAYYPYTSILDFKYLAMLLHNIKIYSIDHHRKLEYAEQKSFISSTNLNENNILTHSPTYEYYLHPVTLSYGRCELTCSTLKAEIPSNILQIREGAKLTKLNNDYLWVKTIQETEQFSGGDWDRMYKYTLHWNQMYEIWPVKKDPHPFSLKNCTLFQNGVKVITPG